MSSARKIRMLVVSGLMLIGLIWAFQSDAKPERITLYVTAVIGAVTALYALLTYEILLQNRTMAKAAQDSAVLTERSLRFSHTANLLFETFITKTPMFDQPGDRIQPVTNPDYQRALNEFNEGGEQKEFVFALIRNKGQGAATAVEVHLTYAITDSSSANPESSVTKHASIQILEPSVGVALCIFISKLATRDDHVSLVSGQVLFGDFYRDAIGEPPTKLELTGSNHQIRQDPGCVIRLS